MRKIRRKRRRKNSVLVVSAVCLLLCLCVGYAAFQTNISITAKGNVVCAGTDATDKIIADSLVDSGSGLYEDSYENGRYVYRGASVNNYITFDGEPWRIIAIESDGTLKIMKSASLGNMPLDSVKNRTDEYCSKGNALTYGCNAWAATSNMVGDITSFVNGSYSGEVTADSSLNIYLNGYYYDNLSAEAQKLIVNYTYNIGGVLDVDAGSTSYTMKNLLEDEAAYQWEGKVALINLSDYIRSNSNDDDYCNIAYGSYYYGNYTTCQDTTWMYSYNILVITPAKSSTVSVWHVNALGFVGLITGSNSVRPVVHLTSGLKLCGSGTEEDPYTIVD